MNRFRKIAVIVLVLEVILLVISNMFLLNKLNNSSGRIYRVEAARVEREIKDGKTPDYSSYSAIISAHEYDPNVIVNNEYVVFEHEGKLYQIEYTIGRDHSAILYTNIGLGLTIVISIILFVYVNNKILKPFNLMSDVSIELAKGNLSAHVNEDKNKFFGKFMWGIDMLRENLENNKEKELSLQKEKKTLILSISHDIKTPLSAIKLYTKALKDDLYDSPEKRAEALEGISRNTEDIEKYVSEIVAASKEDFLNLEVNMGEYYISEVISKINVLYSDKLSTLHTEFKVGEFGDVLIKCDKDRLEEVIQNMLENAIKYGDGKEISISFDSEEDCLLISVNNTGCSINESEIPHLFESFYRGSNSEGVKGSGLGLYICRTLLRMMDGDAFASVNGDSFSCVAVVRKV